MKLLLLLVLVTVVFAKLGPVRYDNFKVYRVIPQNIVQFTSLKKLQQQTTSYSFWTEVSDLYRPVDIQVPPHLDNNFHDFLDYLNLKNEVFIENVQDLIENESAHNEPYSTGSLNWKSYSTLQEINNWLTSRQALHPGIVTVVKGGESYEGRDILGIKIAYREGLKRVFVEGGIHAREWISPATVTYIANELLTSTDPRIRAAAQNREWHIFPSTNPDGYTYTHEVDRLWRKNRNPYGLCYGVDLNRNWGYMWNRGGASNNSCSETFAGSEAFSEKESSTLADYIIGIADKLEMFLGFHSYSQLLMIPFGHEEYEVPENNEELLAIGNNAAKALARRYGTQYEVGNIAEIVYVGSGCTVDWVLGANRNVRVGYEYELRDTGRYGFLLPPEQIIPTGEETLDSILSIIDQVDATS